MVSLVSTAGQGPVSFVERLAGSDAFKSLFREGMNLVEEAAAYLDGPGRAEAKSLPRAEGLAEDIGRAIWSGWNEMTQTQAASEKHKVKLSNQDIATAADVFQGLPVRLRDLVAQSMRLQARIIHLDQLLYARAEAQLPPVASSPVADQIERLRMAFAS